MPPDTILDPPPEPLGESPSGPRNSHLNATAYRIFKLLQWLIETPLCVEALNERLYADPVIRRRLSPDSIWLYVNTLRMIGCRIERPKARNNFCYRLLYHPFGLSLTEEDLETLVQVKSYAQSRLDPPGILRLDETLKRLIAHGCGEDPEKSLRRFFEQSRSYDYEASRRLIRQLEGWIAQPEPPLLAVTYDSATRGRHEIILLPHAMRYERGVLYLTGERADREDPTLLRVDRILEASPMEDPVLKNRLQARQPGRVVIRLFLERVEEYEPFSMGEEVAFVEDPVRPFARIELHSRDFFAIRQKLLERAVPFEVVEPARFRQEMTDCLMQMRQLYAAEEAS